MNPLLRVPIALVLFGSLASCTVKTDSEADTSAECTGPALTSVSESFSQALGSVTLTAQGTVCEGEPTYNWAVESVPVESAKGTSDLNLTDPANPIFQPDVVGTYVFSVFVSDTAGDVTTPQFIVVTISSDNSAPVANCGGNVEAEEDSRVDLDGSQSRDPEGAELSYQWTLSSVPDCSTQSPGTESIFNGNSADPSVVPDCAGVFVVGLTVSDGEQWSDPAFCSITVASGNQVPVADAGDSETLSACTDSYYELDGFGSWDPEGVALSYQWSLVSAPSSSSASDADFSDATLPNPTFHWDVAGSYTFQLQVSDGVSSSTPDIVVYTFTDSDDNYAPVANAGDDVTIAVTPDCETASYVFTCDDCEEEEIDLDASASDDPRDGDELDFLWSESTGELSIASPRSAITTATTPVYAATYGSTISHSWTIDLAVSDCVDTDTDSITVTYTCTGEYSP